MTATWDDAVRTTCADGHDLTGKVAVLIGGTKGIGRATAHALATRGATIVAVGRDRAAGERTRREIDERGGTGMFIAADVALLSDVRRLAAAIRSRYPQVHLLIHTADLFSTARIDSAEGIERSFAVNYLSRFLLNRLLVDRLVAAAPARIIHVAAAGVPGRLNLADVPPRPRLNGLQGHTVGQRANDVYCIEMAARLRGTGVTINTIMPGFVDTDLRRRFARERPLFAAVALLTRPLVRRPDAAAARVLHWATSPETAGRTGELIGMRGRPFRARRRVADPALRRELFERSERLVARISPADTADDPAAAAYDAARRLRGSLAAVYPERNETVSTSEHYVERAGGGRVEGSAPQVPAPHPTHRAARGFFRLGSRLFNPLTVRLAGSRALPMLAVIHHRGRRSARPYATPVGARRTADGFVVPLTFGERSDWFRNVRAAGGCVVRWNGASYPVADPELVGWEVARPACYPVERVVMPWLGIGQFVRLRDDPTGERAAARKGGQEATGRARARRTAPQ